MPVDTRAAADRWMDLLATSHGASTLDALREATDRYQLVKDGLPYITVLRPAFVTASTIASVEATASAVSVAAHAATRRVIEDRAFRLAVGFPAYMDDMAALDGPSGAPSFSCRFDGLFDTAGTIKLIELNTLPGGVHEDFEATRIFAQAPIAREFARTFPFTPSDTRDRLVDALIDAARTLGRSGAVRINCSAESVGDTLAWTQWLGYAATRGVLLSFTPLDALEVRPDGVYAKEGRIDLVMLPVASIVRGGAKLAPLLGAVRAGLVRTFYGLSTGVFAASKILFEALSDPAHTSMFDGETQRLLRNHIPWTRTVRARRTTFEDRDVELLPLLAAERERFVLKPAGSFGGDGVVVGRACAPSSWEKAITLATRRPHVVQEYVAGVPERFPMVVDGAISERMCTADHNTFVWNGTTAGGACVRVGETIHNVKSGASMGALFVLSDAN